MSVLSLIILVPLVTALILALVENTNEALIKRLSIIAIIFKVVIATLMVITFDPKLSGFQLIEHWSANIAIGVDGISLLLVLLTVLLSSLCILSTFYMPIQNIKRYVALFFLLEALIIGTFISLNIIAFYVFFESVLIPMFFIIGIWGGKNRIYATFKLFLYTLFGSLFFLIAIIYIYIKSGGIANIESLSSITINLDSSTQKWLWLAFFIAFAIKIPMFPLHTWLPDAHVQAPTSGSVLLAGVLIKMGAYGFLRLSLPMLPQASMFFSHFVIILSIIAVIYASLVAFAQTDIKKLIAYSSIAHMGFVTAGIFSLNDYGVIGAIFQMISHGLISGALFFCVGMLYNRTHTLEIDKYGGLASITPKFATIFIFLSLASIGLPGTAGFVGEFIPMLGMFKSFKFTTSFMTLGVILGAVYMLFLCKRIIWGINSGFHQLKDLSKFEIATLVPLIGLIVFLGIYPTLILHTYLNPTVTKLLYNILHIKML